MILVVGLGGCAAEQDKGPKNTTEAAAKDSDEAAEDSGEEVSPKGKKWGGWRWKGKRDDCFFRVGKRCFDSEKKACKAARCGKRKCLTDDGAPAKVTCEGDTKKKSESAGDE